MPAWREEQRSSSHQNVSEFKRRKIQFNSLPPQEKKSSTQQWGQLCLWILKEKLPSQSPPFSGKKKAPTTPKSKTRTLSKEKPQVPVCSGRFYLKTLKTHKSEGNHPGKPSPQGWFRSPARTSKNQHSSGGREVPAAALLSHCPSESRTSTLKVPQENEIFPGISKKPPLQTLF